MSFLKYDKGVHLRQWKREMPTELPPGKGSQDKLILQKKKA